MYVYKFILILHMFHVKQLNFLLLLGVAKRDEMIAYFGIDSFHFTY